MMEKGSALLIVDVQRDFCAGGSLAVPQGDEIVPLLNRYIRIFQDKSMPIIASRDWHPPRTVHFKNSGGLWPVHCVQGTEGATFHPGLSLPDNTVIVSKGMDPDRDDEYSDFHGVTEEGLPFPKFLREKGVTRLYVSGIATDYCVKATVLDALANGLAVTLLEDAIRGVNLDPDDSAKAIAEMTAAGAETADISALEY